jgi:hypothetical protein
MTGYGAQIVSLLILGIPVASVTWTVTHEEVFRGPREWCNDRSKRRPELYQRKFFYLFTCEYCFSHYVKFRLLVPGWRGYLIGWLSLVWVANIYMSLFGRLRLDIKHEHVEIAATQTEQQLKERGVQPPVH